MIRSLSHVSLLAALLAAAATACSTSDAAPADPSKPAPPAAPAAASATPAPPDAKATCVAVFERNRACTDDYIPALVQARAKYDVPAGIAAEYAAHPDALIAQAKTEWAEDSEPAAIDALCTQLAASYQDPDAVAAAGACLEEPACGPYTACIMPHFEKRFAK